MASDGKLDAVHLAGIARDLQTADYMGQGGRGIDEWLESRGVTGFADFLDVEIAQVAAELGIVVAGGTLPLLLRSYFMHGFFIGLEAGTRIGRMAA